MMFRISSRLTYCVQLATKQLSHRYSITSSLQKSTTIGYLTDLEGDYEHWKQYLQHSQIFDTSARKHPHQQNPSEINYHNYQPSHEIRLKDDCHFIFGGDLCDRNNGDLRLLIDFLNLKKLYPNRIHFILGNRDINKLRLYFSLKEWILKELYPPLVYWLHGSPQLIEQASKEVKQGDATSKLQWILARTMGSPIAFQSRKAELKDMGLPHSDEDVTQSFIETIAPENGLLSKYLSYGNIALNFGDVVFIHGAIHENNIGWIPPRKAEFGKGSFLRTDLLPETRILNLTDWIKEINQFVKNELHDYQQQGNGYSPENAALTPSEYLWEVEGGYDHRQPGSRLIQYGMGGLPGRKLNNTVIYSSYLHAGKPKYPSEVVSSWLCNQKVGRVIVGHQPHGDCPWTLNSHKIQVISADAAYSKNVLWPIEHFESNETSSDHANSQRYITYDDYSKPHHHLLHQGSSLEPHNYASKHTTRATYAYSEILFHFPLGIEPGQPSQLTINGTLSDRSTYSFDLKNSLTENHSGFIGMKTKDDWFVKAANVQKYDFKSDSLPSSTSSTSKRYYLLSKAADAFRFLNRLVDEQQLIHELYST